MRKFLVEPLSIKKVGQGMNKGYENKDIYSC